MADTPPEQRVYKFIELLWDTPKVEALGDIYAYLLAQADVIESNGREMPFSISMGNTRIPSRLIADSIAFGVLYEQENPSKENSHGAHVVAPFGFHSVDEVISAQGSRTVAEAMEFLRHNPHAWKEPLIGDELADKTGISPSKARPLLLSAVFGTYIEVAQLRDVELDDSIAERIYEKYNMK